MYTEYGIKSQILGRNNKKRTFKVLFLLYYSSHSTDIKTVIHL